MGERKEDRAMSLLPFLDRSHSIAKTGFNRWMVPPAALCIHLCIGQAYAFSVFNLPMSKLIGITQSAPDDWKLTDLGWIFSIAIFVLGFSAAIFGRWVEEGGPRKAMFTSALCWAGGFLISAIGVYVHNIWVVYFGYGLVGGIGLGLGYISPVSTLIKWFPDRPGMATGMAIMGFGGAAFIASPLSVWLMSIFSTSTHIGVGETFVVLGAIYFVFMMVGAFIVRLPAPGWKPEGYVPPVQASRLITNSDVYVYDALKTPQFWCIWIVLCINVTAGIATVPAYLRDMFGTRYVGAIHGLLLTAWSMAGIFGPVLVNYIREYNITHGVPKAQAYNITMYIMAGLFVIGFIANFLIRAVNTRFHMKSDKALPIAAEAGREFGESLTRRPANA